MLHVVRYWPKGKRRENFQRMESPDNESLSGLLLSSYILASASHYWCDQLRVLGPLVLYTAGRSL